MQWCDKAYILLAQTTIGRSTKHYCFTLRPIVLHRVNQYCSAHRPLVLHTTTRYRSARPPSGKDAPTSRARIVYMYHAVGKGKVNRARRTSREGHSNKASDHLLTPKRIANTPPERPAFTHTSRLTAERSYDIQYIIAIFAVH